MLLILSTALDAVILVLLARIAVIDFRHQKIYNREVLILAALGIALLVVKALWRQEQLQSNPWWPFWFSLIIAGVLFLMLLPFWLMRKVGAGDVKLMAVAPLVAGAENMVVFTLSLLAFSIFVAFLIKNPLLLPASAFREYMKHFERKQVVPFGVPISAALAIVVAARVLGKLP